MTSASAKQVRVGQTHAVTTEKCTRPVKKRLRDARSVTAEYKLCMLHTAFALNGLFTVSGLVTVLVKTSERLGAPAVVVLLHR